MRREAERCSGCGIHPSEAGGDPDAFVGNLTHCQWCERMEAERHNIPEGERNSRAWRIGLVRREVALRMMAEQDATS